MALFTSGRRAHAAVSRKLGDRFSFEDLDLSDIRADEVLVKLSSCGMCHTDINFHTGHYAIDLPVVLGHEGAGFVEQLGSSVSDFSVGDRVVLTWGACGRCASCKTGHQAYCIRIPELNLIGNRPDGSSAFGNDVRSHFFGQSSFATYAIVPSANLVGVPEDVPLDLLGPLGCGVQTGAGAVFNSLKVSAGQSLAIWGAGAVGLSALMAAVVVGAHPIFVVDRNRERLKLAADLGATFTYDVAREDPVSQIRLVCRSGVNFSMEAVGSPAALKQAVAVLGPLGVCGMVGGVATGTEAVFDWQHVQLNGISLRGIIEGDSTPSEVIPMLIDLYRRGRLPLEKIVRFYDFKDIDAAISDADSGAVIKPVLLMRGS